MPEMYTKLHELKQIKELMKSRKYFYQKATSLTEKQNCIPGRTRALKLDHHKLNSFFD